MIAIAVVIVIIVVLVVEPWIPRYGGVSFCQQCEEKGKNMVYFLFYADRILVRNGEKIKTRVFEVHTFDNQDYANHCYEIFRSEFKGFRVTGMTQLSKRSFEEKLIELA